MSIAEYLYIAFHFCQNICRKRLESILCHPMARLFALVSQHATGILDWIVQVPLPLSQKKANRKCDSLFLAGAQGLEQHFCNSIVSIVVNTVNFCTNCFYLCDK